MSYPEDQVAELKLLCPGVCEVKEAGCILYFLPGLILPDGCNPARTDALLCPSARDGYASRPNSFAAARVGFLYGPLVRAGTATQLVLLASYQPVADDRYINAPWSGARIDSAAIRGAMQG